MTDNQNEMATGIDDEVDLTDEQPQATPVEGPVEPADAPNDGPDSDADESAPEDDDEEPKGGSKAAKEARRYRLQLRDTQAERDALTEQVTALRRDVVDGIVTASGEGGGRLHSPEAFWAGGIDVDSLLGDDGHVDRAKVLAAVDDVATRFGITRRPRPNHVPGEGANPRPTVKDSMVDTVMGKNR